jgi:hypothetical protein
MSSGVHVRSERDELHELIEQLLDEQIPAGSPSALTAAGWTPQGPFEQCEFENSSALARSAARA